MDVTPHARFGSVRRDLGVGDDAAGPHIEGVQHDLGVKVDPLHIVNKGGF